MTATGHIRHDLATRRVPIGRPSDDPLSAIALQPQQYLLVICCRGCKLYVEQPDGMPDYHKALKQWRDST